MKLSPSSFQAAAVFKKHRFFLVCRWRLRHRRRLRACANHEEEGKKECYIFTPLATHHFQSHILFIKHDKHTHTSYIPPLSCQKTSAKNHPADFPSKNTQIASFLKRLSTGVAIHFLRDVFRCTRCLILLHDCIFKLNKWRICVRTY